MINQTPESLLKSVFCQDWFKPLQRELSKNVLQRRDSLVVMPTRRREIIMLLDSGDNFSRPVNCGFAADRLDEGPG
jgi:hypothetical protein